MAAMKIVFRGVHVKLIAVAWLMVSQAVLVLSQEMIAFPSGIRYETVAPDNGRTSRDAPLFDGNGVENKKLSLSFKVSAFKDASQDLFRADPVLFKCVQKVQNAMQKEGERLEIVSGYVPSSEISSTNHHDVYQSTGAAIRVKIKANGSPPNLDKNYLIQAVGKNCVPVFQQINRDIGVADLGSHIQIHIQGPDEIGPYYNPSSVTGIVQEGIEAAYDLTGVAMCPQATSPSLSAGELFPDVGTIAEAVGGLEEPITRDNTEDFGKLAQYPANHIVFEDTERTSTWCGQVGNQCQDCKSRIVGSTLNLRCADRTMSYRLMRFMRSLGKAVSLEWPGVKLRVLEAWDEAHQLSTNGDTPEGSLHYEGRAAIVNTNDGDATKLERLSQLAICAGLDAVQRNSDHLLLAVVKQMGSVARTVGFSDNQELVEVEPPAAKAHMYNLRDEFSDTEAKEYPLFDSADRHDFRLGQDVTLGMFVPRDGRYLRLSPHIVNCFQSVVIAEQKLGMDPPLQVCRSYFNRMETESEIDIFDKRYVSSGLGVSMELSYNCSASKEPLDLYDQMQLVIEQCAPIFYMANGKSMGIGLYNRFIAVDIRPTFKAWAATADLREDATELEFTEYFQRWHTRAIQGRVVDADDYEEACLASTQPYRQSIDFSHKEPEKSFAPDGNDPERCVPQGNTAFCTSTQKHRDVEFTRIRTEVHRKHLLHDESEVDEALKLCVGTSDTCGTCQEGMYWDRKVQHCDNFLHWVPFEFLNDVDDVNFYLQESFDLKHYACAGHCLNKSPLFSLMVPTMEKLYRPKEDESIKERLYTVTNNPSPVMELMHRMYAMSAKGIVKVWVVNEIELITLKDPLKYVCLYNKDVTKVEIFVAQSSNKDIVHGQMQTFYSEWVKQGCPDYARKFLPPYSVADLPPHMSKRSAEFDLREQMLHHHRTWEDRWLNGHPLI